MDLENCRKDTFLHSRVTRILSRNKKNKCIASLRDNLLRHRLVRQLHETERLYRGWWKLSSTSPGRSLTSMEGFYTQRCRKKANSIRKDPNGLLCATVSTKLRGSFIPQAMRLLNSWALIKLFTIILTPYRHRCHFTYYYFLFTSCWSITVYIFISALSLQKHVLVCP